MSSPRPKSWSSEGKLSSSTSLNSRQGCSAQHGFSVWKGYPNILNIPVTSHANWENYDTLWYTIGFWGTKFETQSQLHHLHHLHHLAVRLPGDGWKAVARTKLRECWTFRVSWSKLRFLHPGKKERSHPPSIGAIVFFPCLVVVITLKERSDTRVYVPCGCTLTCSTRSPRSGPLRPVFGCRSIRSFDIFWPFHVWALHLHFVSRQRVQKTLGELGELGEEFLSMACMAPWLQVVSEDITFWHAPGFKGSGAAEKPWKWTMDTMDIDGWWMFSGDSSGCMSSLSCIPRTHMRNRQHYCNTI